MDWIICDWANNRPFGWETFPTMEEADQHLEAYLFARVCGNNDVTMQDHDLNDEQWHTFYDLKGEYWIRPNKEARKGWI